MHIHAPERVAFDDLTKTTIYANVFNGSERSQVEMQFGKTGKWIPMQHTRAIDPAYKAIFEAEAAALAKNSGWRKLSNPHPSSHLWKAPLPSELAVGKHTLRVRTQDQYGREYSEERTITIK